MADEQKPVDRREFLLNEGNIVEAGKFVRGPLWADFKRVLLAKCPEKALVSDEPHVAAAKGFVATTWVEVIQEIERLPFEAPPVSDALIPPELLDHRD